MSLFSPKAIELGPWSPSKIKMGDQCPWKFNRTYVEKRVVPPDMMPELSDTALRVGSAVHLYAEGLAKGMEAARASAAATAKNRLVSEELETFKSMTDNTEAFIERIEAFGTKFPVSEDLIEHKLAINEELEDSDFWDDDTILRGVIDRSLIVDNQYAVMIDIKTSSFATLKYSDLQLSSYALLAFRNWPELKFVQPALYFVPSNQLLWAPKVYREGYSFGGDNPVISHINTTAEEVISDEIRPGNYCSWCKYKPMCLTERKVRRKAAREAKKKNAKVE